MLQIQIETRCRPADFCHTRLEQEHEVLVTFLRARNYVTSNEKAIGEDNDLTTQLDAGYLPEK
ncbi:hypothetical protein PsorP6_015350 [Peronosclerospora sorghi]|uniref:Uncharacterized protein n=1 Tax=Peronosclerospora sorghi TaxID=230839 RepID=A0ACC0VT22_9STRA|nr:hypothetical protein PsorP6_015350 [Peronosclerospora sorghi]